MFRICRRVRSKRLSVVMVIAMLLWSAGAPRFVPTVKAQASAGVGFNLDAGDLRFIFRQIQIAQAHSAGGQLFGTGPNQVQEPRLPFGLRTVDGSFNHLTPGKTEFGASDNVFPRMTTPVFRAAEQGTSYAQTSGAVIDSQPRIISNLIVDQTANNPAAQAVVDAGSGSPIDENGNGIIEPNETGFFIPNVAPDVGLSAPFNQMFTFFGQFFDHGLDLLNKGGSGVVIVPLQADDPLVAGPDGIFGNADDLPADRRFIPLTRGTNLPGPDGILGTADDIHEGTNQTSPFVDQNQTYTSHPSHQVFLREYELNAAGRPVSTGKMIDGGGLLNGVPVRNIGNWGEVKAQAKAMLGIDLSDADALNVPLLLTDDYGYFRRAPNGFAQMVLAAGGVRAGNPNPAVLVTTNGVVKTGHAFLDDIAHSANPFGDHDDNPATPPQVKVADDDAVIGDDGDPATYDDELLGEHFVTGDGRGNENIALTAVHTIFHSEHNRLARQIGGEPGIPGLIDTLLTPAEAAAWRAVDPASGWNFGERVFQAAKFVTEMQYQHLVFEEFARKLVPSINEFIGDGINFQGDVNPAIVAEFAHQTYRLGHSMLTETISRTNEDGSINDITLLDGFLNPLAFNDGGAAGRLTAAQAAGAIFQGGTRQVGNEIDEFVTDVVRNRLLGLPLDLPVFNLARGRDQGIPPLNEVRRQLYLATSDPSLVPYQNWKEFEFASKHPESVINFIAAYGIHPTLAAATTLADKRAAATALFTNAAFMFAPAADTGVNNIDLWIGGLAEKIAPFGSMLGPTFNKVFEVQLENLQNNDRFYYLERLDGLNLIAQLEGNSFALMIERNTTFNGGPASVFSRPDFIFNLTSLLRIPGVISDDPSTPDDESVMPDLVLLPDGTIRYLGPAHVIWNGRNDPAIADHIHSSEGDDTLRGDAGNDIMEGGAGNDEFLGGDGDDILVDIFGEDNIKGGLGNDAISGGSGPFDLLQGGAGHDFIVGGNDSSEVFGGSGNDVIYVGKAVTESFGGAGDDWIEGSDSPASVLVGDENNQFQNDLSGGHDVIIAGPGDADMDSEGGDDIMVATVTPTHRLEGMFAFDWATYRGDPLPVDADMLVSGLFAVLPDINELRDRFDFTEGLSGWNQNDILRGDDRADLTTRELGGPTLPNADVLTPAGIDRITGLRAVVGGQLNLDTDGNGVADSFSAGNIILGGAGSDLIEGRGGNDIIDGDAWLNVQLGAPDLVNGGTKKADSLHAFRTDVFAGRTNPGDFQIFRTIETTGASPANVDTALFTGPATEYLCGVTDPTGLIGISCADPRGAAAFVRNPDGSLKVTHIGTRPDLEDNERLFGVDGIDTLRNIEQLRFAGIVDEDTSVPVQIVPVNTNVLATVPGVQGQTQAAATNAIIAARLSVGAITFANHDTVPPGSVISQTPGVGAIVSALSPVDLVLSLGAVNVLVPSVLGQSADQARATLSAARLTVGNVSADFSETIAAGLVISQDPAVDESVPPGTAVSFVTSLGAENVQVPSVVTLTRTDAINAIRTAGLVEGVTEANSDTVAAGIVISQNPPAESPARPGSTVNIVVSLGPAVPPPPPPPPPPANRPPVANNDVATTDAGVAVTIAVLANDSDPDGNALTVTGTAAAVGGVAAVQADGRVRYTPAAGFSGAGSFTYTISDGAGGTASASVSVTVNAPPPPPPPPPAPAPVGLVLSLSFDTVTGTSVSDGSGSNNHGTVLGALPAEGKVGGALQFDGVNDWVTVADSASLDLTTGMTIEAWVNPAPFSGWETVVLKQRGAGDLAYALYAHNAESGPSGYVNVGGEHQGVDGTPAVASGVWTHLATTYDGTTQRIYINGQPAGSRAQTGNIAVSGGVLRIGGNSSFADEFYAGRIDEVRVYNRALSVDEINADMNGAAPPPPPPPPGPVNRPPVATNDTATTNAGAAVVIAVLANDSDPDGNALTVTATANAVGGVTVIQPDQRVTFTPNAGFAGAGSFTYTISDGQGGTAGASVSVTVNAPAPPPPPPPPPPVSTEGLVLALDFEETGGTVATDSSGGGRHGTIREAVSVAGGKFGRALSFDGVNDWVTVADTAALNLTSGMTLEAWVNPTALSGWETVIMKEAGSGLTYALYAHDGAPLAGGVAAPAGYIRIVGDRVVRGTAAIPTGQWTHLATTYDGANQRIYVNGALVVTRAQTGNIAVQGGVLRIGGNGAFANEFFQGLIDQVRVYNRAKSEAEINADVNPGTPTQP